MLTIYADSIVNEGTIESSGSTPPISKLHSNLYTPGGASGGGSINIFYSKKIETKETTDEAYKVTGGDRITYYGTNGAGGKGTITIGNISSGIFVKDE